MKPSRQSIEQAVEDVRQKLAESIAPGEPGAVAFVSSNGERASLAAAGAASLNNLAPLTIDTSFDTGSVAKIVTGLAVAMLEEEGALAPSMRMRELLPELPAYTDSLRVEHLLHHESGLRSYFTFLYYIAGWHPRRPPSSDEVFEALCRVGRLAFAPGSRHEYSDSNYFLLGRIVERLAGEPLGAFVQRRILTPLGMQDSYFTDVDSAGRRKAEGYVTYPLELRSSGECRRSAEPGVFCPVRLSYRHVGAEGFCASASDLARLGAHILSPTLLRPTSMRDRVLCAPRIREDGFGYGYGLNVGTYRGRRFIGHDGQIWGYSASLAVFPDEDLELICLSNRDDLCAWTLRSALLDALEGEQIRPLLARQGQSAAGRTLARYLDPTSARRLEIVEQGDGQAVSIEGAGPVPVEIEPDGTLRGGGLTLATSCACRAHPSLLVCEGDGQSREFIPFWGPGRRETFAVYAGTYTCEKLRTTFDVEATEAGIRLANRDAMRPSMNLEYEPTIPDFFRSEDPYPELSQLQFLREAGSVYAFIYRDPDGDRREDFCFARDG